MKKNFEFVLITGALILSLISTGALAETGYAVHYSDVFQGRKTANNEIFDQATNQNNEESLNKFNEKKNFNPINLPPNKIAKNSPTRKIIENSFYFYCLSLTFQIKLIIFVVHLENVLSQDNLKK